LAKAEKYRIDFKTLQGDSCRVSFFYEGFVGSVTTLYGGIRPFVLKEFNTDEDLFKPIRPQMAEIEILASSTGIDIDDFLSTNDTDIEVRFFFSDLFNYYWIGYLLQDDFQETWVDSAHYITVRASEAIGLLKGKEIEETNGDELSGKYNFLEMIQIAMNSTSQNFTKFYVFNNLFHSSMTDTSTYTGLDQAFFHSKTFLKNPPIYDDCYTVLEKINKAWNQTLFMYNGYWNILRIEELNIPTSENLRGFVSNSSVRTAINRRYDVEVGVDEEVKPISPDMLRFIQRKTKKDTIQFDYNQFDEIVCNGAFNRGSLVSSSSTTKVYNLDDWGWYEGAINSTIVPTSGSRGRQQNFDSSTQRLTDEYAFLTQDSTNNRFLKSCAIEVLQNEKLSFSIDTQYANNFTGAATLGTVVMMLYGVTTNYTLDDDGKWYASNASWSTNLKQLSIYYNGTPAISPIEWNTLQIDSEQFPEAGTLRILLYLPNTPYSSGQERRFKSLSLEIFTSASGNILNNITGVQSIFTKAEGLNNYFEDTIYFDDGLSKLYDGSIFEDDETTLTGKTWYRYRYNTEEFGFRKENAVARWAHNRFNRNKIDANFYGLKYNSEPIGLINTIRFIDDDPNKVYAILNLKEIDFSSATWVATLEEVYNSATDGDTSYIDQSFEADVTTGTYNNPTLVPWTIVSAANFSITGGNTITYNGTTSITTNIVISLAGSIRTTTSTPVTTTFQVKQNSTVIKTQNYPVTVNPQAFTFNLSPSGAITINPGDTFTVTVSNNITQIQYTSGQFNLDYSYPTAITYDPYEDKYLYK
jgi:hypothetical protein